MPAEAEVITSAAAAILDLNISLKAVARDLRERQVPTVTGTAWSAKTLRDVLIKPAVGGLAVRDGELVPAPWPAILGPGTWERLRDLLTDPARRTNTSRANEPRWLVSGFATCGVCGGPLRAGGGANRAAAYIGKDCCHVRRNAASVDDLIGEAVIGWLDRYASTRLRPRPAAPVNARALRAERDRLRRQREALLGEFEGDPVALRVIRGKEARIAAIEAELAASHEPDPLPEFRTGEPARALWDAAPVARRRAIVQALIESVVIKRAGRRGQGFDPDTVTVTWRPQAAP